VTCADPRTAAGSVPEKTIGSVRNATPAVGALLLAFDTAGIPTAPVLENIACTLPPADFFATLSYKVIEAAE